MLDVAALVSGQIPNRRPKCDSDIQYSVLILTKNWTCCSCIITIGLGLGDGIVVFIVSLISLVLRSKAHHYPCSMNEPTRKLCFESINGVLFTALWLAVRE